MITSTTSWLEAGVLLLCTVGTFASMWLIVEAHKDVRALTLEALRNGRGRLARGIRRREGVILMAMLFFLCLAAMGAITREPVRPETTFWQNSVKVVIVALVVSLVGDSVVALRERRQDMAERLADEQNGGGAHG